MSIFVSLGIWGFGVRSVRCLFLVTYFALQRRIPSACIGVSNVLYVGLIFQRHEIYFTCSFFLRCKRVSTSAVYPAVTSLPHADGLLDHNTHLFTLSRTSPLSPLSTQTFATTIIPPLSSKTEPKLRTKTIPTHQRNPTHSLPKMSSTNLTDNDRKLLAAAWHCFETQPKVSPSLTTATIPPSESTRQNNSHSHSLAWQQTSLHPNPHPTAPRIETSQQVQPS
jgi:hypothetical protein